VEERLQFCKYVIRSPSFHFANWSQKSPLCCLAASKTLLPWNLSVPHVRTKLDTTLSSLFIYPYIHVLLNRTAFPGFNWAPRHKDIQRGTGMSSCRFTLGLVPPPQWRDNHQWATWGVTITLRHTIFGWTPLDEWSARRINLYLTTHNTHNKQTSMLPAGFEPIFSAGERP
jgi:hypothetical protein